MIWFVKYFDCVLLEAGSGSDTGVTKDNDDNEEVDEEESVEEVVTKIEQLRQVASLLLKQAQELEAMILW